MVDRVLKRHGPVRRAASRLILIPQESWPSAWFLALWSTHAGAVRSMMVLLDLMGVPFLEEAEICRTEQNRCASSRKDPCQPSEFLKSLNDC